MRSREDQDDEPRQRVEPDPLRRCGKADEHPGEGKGPPGAARPSARPDLPEDQVGGGHEGRHEDVVHADPAHDVAHRVDRDEGRGEQRDAAPAEERGDEQVDDADQGGAERDAGEAPGERVAARVDAHQARAARAVNRAHHESAVIVALPGLGDVEGHRHGGPGQARGVECRHADRAVASRLDVRLERPDLRLTAGGDPRHVHDARHRLVLDEQRRTGQRDEPDHAGIATAPGVAPVGVDDRQAARRRRVLVRCEETGGDGENLLLIAAAPNHERTDQRRVRGRRVTGARREARGIQEDHRAGGDVGGHDPIGILGLDALHEADAAVAAVGGGEHLVAGAVDRRDRRWSADEDRSVGRVRDGDLAHRVQLQPDRRACGGSAPVG